ncbi:MAG: NAD-dependent epimerase/dehydratase family protein, partial [Clostridiales bacterium]|nr:NAD-dependent epimerase/dehydratase family protein [Clostridiales bacterium]
MQERRIDTAVVTGPTGAVGSALCRRLLDEGATVWAVVRPLCRRLDALPAHEKLHIVECDVSNLASLPEIMAETHIDALFHLAWAGTTGASRNDMPVQIDNIRYTIDAVRAAAALGASVFVGTGSQAEYGRAEGALTASTSAFPENGYGMAKLCAGAMSRAECKRLGLDHVWARILSVYGPYDTPSSMISHVIAALLNGEKPALTAGVQLWDYLYSGDAARALYLCARSGRDGAVYPLGGGQSRPLKEYIEALR